MSDRESNNNILVPVDFSEVSMRALDHAVKLAKIYGNEITLLYIFEERPVAAILGVKRQNEELIDAIKAKMDTVIDPIVKEHGIVMNKMVKEGRIYKQIIKIADEQNFDSVIMGTTGAHGMEKIMGSNASKVIGHSTVPVIVVSDKQMENGYDKIVLPIDLTLETRQKVVWAVKMAKQFNSTIHVIFETETDEFVRQKILASVNNVQGMLDKNGVKYEVRSLDDKDYPENFAQDTIQYADEIDADLIIIMTQQEKNFAELIIGSYAQRVVNGSTKPVMCINPRPAGYIVDGVFG
jgi:nucleotide-binding universal stress UspA family protein